MRIRKALSICALFVLPIFILMGCTAHRTYPREKASLWICEEPHFVINYAGYVSETYLEWEGEKYVVALGLHASSFDVFLRSDDNILHEENILLRGRWEYKGRNMIVKISEDNIFGGAYKELVFVPQK